MDRLKPKLKPSNYLFVMVQRKENRQHARQLVRIEGTAVASGGLERTALFIVNLSSSGAMVELSRVIKFDGELVLLFQRTAEPCRIVWRRERLAGLQFLQAPVP